MAPDMTLLNLNMLYIRHYDRVDRERHLPLGPLYVTAALEQAGFHVDLRDHQLSDAADPLAPDAMLTALADPAPVIGVSCMANLLPFVLLGLQRVKEAHPKSILILGGVGPKGVEKLILARCPWIDVIVLGEAEISAPLLLSALKGSQPLTSVPGICFRSDGQVAATPRPPRITDLSGVCRPRWDQVDLSAYAGYNVMSSRGCPYECTFCSVAPVWDHVASLRSPEDIVDEMADLHDRTGTDLFLFQDEYFVSSKPHVLGFCQELKRRGLKVKWKAFGRVDLVDEEMMASMADAGCVELRFGVESGCDRILQRVKKGFTAATVVATLSKALDYFPRVDAFYVWGFPFESMDEFRQTVFQMIYFRGQGVRILPSLLCLLPQTTIYEEIRHNAPLEFCPDLFPEYMLTGHETCIGSRVSIAPQHQVIFDFVRQYPDMFPGFFHYKLEENVLPKLQVLQRFGFYREAHVEPESCGAHSPRAVAVAGDSR